MYSICKKDGVHVKVVRCCNVSSNVRTCFISNIAPQATGETDAENARTYEISFADKKEFPVFVSKSHSNESPLGAIKLLVQALEIQWAAVADESSVP